MASRTSAALAGVSYLNGRMPVSLLRELKPYKKHGSSGAVRAYLRKDAADAWNRAQVEVQKKTGIVLTVRGWYRTFAEQAAFYNRPHSAAVAVPGYSNHGLGMAVDVKDFGGVGDFSHPRRVKSIAILKKHGFTEEEGRRVREPWHLVYDPASDKGKRNWHYRVTTSVLNVRRAPSQSAPVYRVAKKGERIKILNGKSRTVGGLVWVQTTRKNWVAEKYTRKV